MDREAWWAIQSMGRKESNMTERLTLHFRPHLGPWGACATSSTSHIPRTLGHFRHAWCPLCVPHQASVTADKYVMTALPVLLTLPTRGLDALLWLRVGVGGWGVEESHPYAAPPGCPGHSFGLGGAGLPCKYQAVRRILTSSLWV